jgi:hypothetical protein
MIFVYPLALAEVMKLRGEFGIYWTGTFTDAIIDGQYAIA